MYFCMKPIQILQKGLTWLKKQEAVEVLPTLHEIMAAVMTIQRTLATVDEPFACKLEGLLPVLTHHVHLEQSHTL